VVVLEGPVHGGHPGRSGGGGGGGGCASGWNCVVAAVPDGNVKNKKIKNMYR